MDLHKTIYQPGCFSENEVSTITDGYYSMQDLMMDWEGYPVHLTEFQTLGFWQHRHESPEKAREYRDDLVHIEYQPPNHWRARHPENSPKFADYLKSKKHILDVEEFHYYIVDVLTKRLTEAGRDMSGSNEFIAISIYDLDYGAFETHTDGRDVLCKKDPRPKNFDFSSMKPEEWLIEKDRTHTHQGLVPIACDDPKDGTVIFDQTFDYSVYLNMGRDPFEDWAESFSRKQMIKIGRGDSIERFGTKVGNYTDKPMSDTDYDWIMENCFDEELFPIEHGYGLSIETMCEFHSNGTLYDWDARRFHRTRPRIVKPDEKRVTLVYGCAKFHD